MADGAHPGRGGVLRLFLGMPFMILRAVPHTADLLRHEVATATGAQALTAAELTPADDQTAVRAALAAMKSRDTGFDLAATTAGVVRAREVVDLARRTGDPSAARPVMSDGLWQLFFLLLQARSGHRVSRQGISAVTATAVVAATHDQLAEQLRIRLTCQGERQEIASETVLRGQPGQLTWYEDWIIRRSADASTPARGGVLSGRCPNCGATLDVDANGSCMYCKALVLSGGRDWVVWSIEEAPW
jgi:hypothetical protein